MTYRITQAHDGWRASFEGHGVRIVIPPMKKEEEAITNLNRILVYHGLSRMQLPVRTADTEIIETLPLEQQFLYSKSLEEYNKAHSNRALLYPSTYSWYRCANSALNTLYNYS